MNQKIEAKKLISHLESKWHGKICQMCGTGNWTVSDSIFELRQFNQGNLIIGEGPITPVITVTCTNCGNTILVNAIIAGLIEPIKK